MAEIIAFPRRASKLAYLPEPDYFVAILAEALVLETAHNLAPDDEEILHRLMTARELLIALQPAAIAEPLPAHLFRPFLNMLREAETRDDIEAAIWTARQEMEP